MGDKTSVCLPSCQTIGCGRPRTCRPRRVYGGVCIREPLEPRLLVFKDGAWVASASRPSSSVYRGNKANRLDFWNVVFIFFGIKSRENGRLTSIVSLPPVVFSPSDDTPSMPSSSSMSSISSVLFSSGSVVDALSSTNSDTEKQFFQSIRWLNVFKTDQFTFSIIWN